MANLKILSKTAQYGIIRQDPSNVAATAFKAAGNVAGTSWNDPGVPGTNFRQVAYDVGSVIFDPAITLDQYQSTAQNGIHMEDDEFFADSRSGLPTMTFSMPADQKTIAPHLAGALLGTVTEDASTPFSKSINCGGLTGAIDFSVGDAELVTLSMTDKASADDGIILEDCIIGDLSLEWDFNSQGVGRLVQMAGTWVGSELNFEQNMGGATVTTTLTPYNNAETYSFSTLSVDGQDWSGETFRKYIFSVNNNVRTTNRTGASGKAKNYDVTPEYTSSILLDYNAVTEKVLGDYQAGASIIATIASSTTPTSDGGISIAGVKGRLMTQPFEYNEEFHGVQLDIKWYANNAATPITVIVTDTLDWVY